MCPVSSKAEQWLDKPQTEDRYLYRIPLVNTLPSTVADGSKSDQWGNPINQVCIPELDLKSKEYVITRVRRANA